VSKGAMMGVEIIHVATTYSTTVDLKKNDLVVLTKSATSVVSDTMMINSFSSPNGRGVKKSGNDYTTYTSRNYYFMNEDIASAVISTPATAYTSYLIFVFRPTPGSKFLNVISTDVIDAEIYAGTNTYDFSANTGPVLCLCGLTIGWSPNCSISVNGGISINNKSVYSDKVPSSPLTATLSTGDSYARWGSVGLAFPMLKTIQAQAQIIC
jgi:hypothetical protein